MYVSRTRASVRECGVRPGLDPQLDQLTFRERDVLRLVAAGTLTRRSVRGWQISARTVETHIAAVLR
ncbi:LuxR C-terminal-related transcriptional regulator [Phytohabitans sp. LJ34]|uniref:LuxR C-terminal-related transcriptional regulator n=1 Tax=Phytohabitans sp. LJ34 TaxID=3452217 RepID=UPI003F8ABB9A